MSWADGLFAMRYSGSSRASSFLAGSSDGNGLSVMAIRVRGMVGLFYYPLPWKGRVDCRSEAKAVGEGSQAAIDPHLARLRSPSSPFQGEEYITTQIPAG